MKSWVNHMRNFRSGPVQIARLLVAHEDSVYTTLGLNEPVVAIDGKTGKTIKTYEATRQAEEILYHQCKLLVVVNKSEVEHGVQSGPFSSFSNKAVKLVDTETGQQLWRWPAEGFADIVPTTLAAQDQQVYFQCGYDTMALDLTSGQELWRKNTFEDSPTSTTGDDSGRIKKDKKGKKQRTKEESGGEDDGDADAAEDGDARDDEGIVSVRTRPVGWVSNTLVAHKDIVLTANSTSLVALSAEDGSKLWEAPAQTPFGRTSSVDILVIDDLVWTSPSFSDGRHYRTGEVVRTLNLKEVMVTTGHHHRCYRNRGAGDFIIFGYRGMEFFDTKDDEHSRSNWVHGVCQWGVGYE
jgi:hypothetical protein